MSRKDDFFIGWRADAPRSDRRFLLLASLGLVAAGAFAGAGLARHGPRPGPGSWDQARMQRYSGILIEDPYPMLLTRGPRGDLRPMLIVAYDKVALPRQYRPPQEVELEASAITRGPNTMLAIENIAAWNALREKSASLFSPTIEDFGHVLRSGEILDAKCWFGAMNPGFGTTHKACATLCAHGRLPLAFCPNDECQAGEEACLFLNETGHPHDLAIIPFVAGPVVAEGRLVRRNGLLEFRVGISQIKEG